MRLTYAILFAGEASIVNLLCRLNDCARHKEASIVLLVDNLKIHPHAPTVSRAIRLLHDFCEHPIYCQNRTFDHGDFSRRRNELNSMCMSDWVFQIDPDELPTVPLLEFAHNMIIDSPLGYELPDAYAIARENLVTGVTRAYVEEQKWTMDALGRINWPDYQIRLYRKSKDIFWVGKVHETLNQVPNLHRIEPTGKFLRHHKTFERQKEQNESYLRLTGHS